MIKTLLVNAFMVSHNDPDLPGGAPRFARILFLHSKNDPFLKRYGKPYSVGSNLTPAWAIILKILRIKHLYPSGDKNAEAKAPKKGIKRQKRKLTLWHEEAKHSTLFGVI